MDAPGLVDDDSVEFMDAVQYLVSNGWSLGAPKVILDNQTLDVFVYCMCLIVIQYPGSLDDFPGYAEVLLGVGGDQDRAFRLLYSTGHRVIAHPHGMAVVL